MKLNGLNPPWLQEMAFLFRTKWNILLASKQGHCLENFAQMDSKAAIFIWFQRIGDLMFSSSWEEEVKATVWDGLYALESILPKILALQSFFSHIKVEILSFLPIKKALEMPSRPFCPSLLQTAPSTADYLSFLLSVCRDVTFQGSRNIIAPGDFKKIEVEKLLGVFKLGEWPKFPVHVTKSGKKGALLASRLISFAKRFSCQTAAF